MPRVRVVTERDVRRAAKDGTREIDVAGAVVTPSARDVAARAGVTLAGAKPSGKSASRGKPTSAVATPPVAPAPANGTSTATVRSVAVGADHGGVALRDAIATRLKELGHTVTDHGTTGSAAVD